MMTRLNALELHEVKSSNLVRLGYDLTSSTLVVEFKSGTKYAYAGVGEKLYYALLGARSIGAYFHADIRSKFLGVKLVPEPVHA
jgi:hypothetical protein